jgi:hypothetical protein
MNSDRQKWSPFEGRGTVLKEARQGRIGSLVHRQVLAACGRDMMPILRSRMWPSRFLGSITPVLCFTMHSYISRPRTTSADCSSRLFGPAYIYSCKFCALECQGGLESAGRAGTGVKWRSLGKGAESRPGCSFFVFVLMGETSPAGHGQEAVIRCIYAMAAKRPLSRARPGHRKDQLTR